MQHIMLDLETMGNGSNAAIIAIGAVRFNETALGEKYYQVVDLESSVNAGGKIDPSTVMWWMKQSDQARSALARPDNDLFVALMEFSVWLRQCDANGDCRIWGNGSDFDNVILSNAYRCVKLETPWKFYNNRCYRTIKSLYPGVQMQRSGTHHNAVDDAISQARHLQEIAEREHIILR